MFSVWRARCGCAGGPSALVCVLLLAPVGSLADATVYPEDADVDGVSDGSLELLSVPPGRPVHTHSNRIELDRGSLQHGWAALTQCHRHLDPVENAQIVYNAGRVRALAVLSSTDIGEVRVEGTTVQMRQVGKSARLCVQAESRVVHLLAGGRFAVKNGPFMRGFLDGYYPMHVTLEIVLPPGNWRLERSEPRAQPGFSVSTQPGKVSADAWFNGRLLTEFYFRPADTGE